MSYVSLYVEPRPLTFAGSNKSLDEARIVVLGVPFDSTASYRPGQREGPEAVRKASMNIEGNGYFVDKLIDEVPLHDLGDLAVVHGNALETIYRVEKVVGEVSGAGKTPVLIGGEHTITLGAVKGLPREQDVCLLVFDAHYDLRNEYLGEKYSHACVMRRVLEAVNVGRIVYVGVRAYEREERELALKDPRISYLSPERLEIAGVRGASSQVIRELAGCEYVYISIDIDVYDPAYAPGAANPEPLGLAPREVFFILKNVIPSVRVVGADLVEVTPSYDPSGSTSILAAKTLQELILLVSEHTQP